MKRRDGAIAPVEVVDHDAPAERSAAEVDGRASRGRGASRTTRRAPRRRSSDSAAEQRGRRAAAPASSRSRSSGVDQRTLEELAHDAERELALELAPPRGQHGHPRVGGPAAGLRGEARLADPGLPLDQQHPGVAPGAPGPRPPRSASRSRSRSTRTSERLVEATDIERRILPPVPSDLRPREDRPPTRREGARHVPQHPHPPQLRAARHPGRGPGCRPPVRPQDQRLDAGRRRPTRRRSTAPSRPSRRSRRRCSTSS